MMIYLVLNQAGEVIAVETEHVPGAQYRMHWHSLEQVEKLAAEASQISGTLYVGTDSGPSVYPRFDIVKAPCLGDEVSMTFNGDYYPCGKITKISDSLRRIATSSGRIFYRYRQSPTWAHNRTWSMVPGNIDQRNPGF